MPEKDISVTHGHGTYFDIKEVARNEQQFLNFSGESRGG
jgi:hypothetical protein